MRSHSLNAERSSRQGLRADDAKMQRCNGESRLPAMRWSWPDEVAVLQEALQQAIAKQGTAENLRETGHGNSPRGKEALDSALAAYGMQLRAWLDVQVDARLGQILPNLLQGELATVHAESSTVSDAVETLRQKSEADIASVAEAQSKLLQVVEGMSRELARWKADRGAGQKNSSHDSRQLELSSELKRLKEQVSSMERQLASEDESVRELSAWAQRRFAGEGHRSHELERKVSDLERRVRSRLDEGDIESKTEVQLRALERQLESRLGSQGRYSGILPIPGGRQIWLCTLPAVTPSCTSGILSLGMLHTLSITWSAERLLSDRQTYFAE
eukprot:TRINITY_DN10360_c0_g1_i1.p1 TRINITY_DN10360_c0_g1~~TRINITY_DN10360_c0_g1_i1.p1  ORF type:complete len:330 (-),score=43.14 TRINITY_DN10360_c0_g1_i1:181-1170(-)